MIVGLISVILGYITFHRYGRYGSGLGQVDDFRDLISELTEMIIPQTDTPGAKEAKVYSYIINVVTNCFSTRDKNIFLRGLIDLERYSFSHFKTSFVNCNEPDKTQVISYFEDKGSYSSHLLNKVRRKIQGRSFFEQLKWLTVSGYCTSMLGATEGLAYEHIPRSYSSCTTLKPGQKSWATK